MTQDRQAWQQWLNSSAEHQWAWAQVERLQLRIKGAPAQLVYATLHSDGVARQASRRALLKGGLALAAGVSLVSAGYSSAPLPEVFADYTTAVGERTGWRLAEGSALTLDTQSRADVSVGPEYREVALYQGRVLVDVAADRRPFRITTRDGCVLLQRGLLCVQQLAGRTLVGVAQGHVEIVPPLSPAGIGQIHRGQMAGFTRRTVSPAARLTAATTSWKSGWLVADDWTLGALIQELGRYRRGIVSCDDQVAALRISGAFSLDNFDDALKSIARTLPVRPQHLTHYWTRLRAV
ncbi:MAG: Protein FecR [Pseudomonas citronellolis]|nr:MAG: Protein FecR [Pseudomonas citronellolis]